MNMLSKTALTGATIALCVGLATFAETPYKVDVPLGLPELPMKNELTKERVELGEKLFFDKSFGFTGKTSCASCHIPEHGYSDFLPLGFTSFGATLQRNTPTTLNAIYNDYQFWDGRAPSLERQVEEVFHATTDANVNLADVIEQVRANPDYAARFQKAFGTEPNIEDFTHAIACYENTLLSGNTRFDRYFFGGEKTALTDAEVQGLEIFQGKGNCTSCHSINAPTAADKGFALFMDESFHNLGVGFTKDGKLLDAGRYGVTANRKDFGSFKTPTLRNVELTAPYMHDGSFSNLEQVVDFHDKGGHPNPNLDPLMKPLALTSKEKKALVAFLHSLTDEKYAKIRMSDAKMTERIKNGTAP